MIRRVQPGAVGLVAVVVATVALAFGDPHLQAPGPPATLAPPSGGSPTFPPASPAGSRRPDPSNVVGVPASVDVTGRDDVTRALQQVIDAAPDGSLIRFPAAARYRIEGTLLIADRRDLVIDGHGGALVATTLTDDPERAHLRLRSSRGITVRDLAILGANPDPGVFRAGFEWQHGVAVLGGGDVTLERLTVDRPMGDCVYIADDGAAWAAGVRVLDSTCRGAARQGIAVVGGRRVLIERSTFGAIGLSVLDLEPAAAGPVAQGAQDIVFRHNIVDGPVGEKLLNATGVGSVRDVVVESTRVSGARWGIATQVAPHAGSPRFENVVFRDNTAEGAFVGSGHAVLLFGDVDGLVLEANRQRIDHAHSAITLVRVCDVTMRDNDLAPFDVVEVRPGACP